MSARLDRGARPMRTDRSALLTTFNEAVIALGHQCRRLESAIASRYAHEVVHAAQNAANFWLAGRRACRRLEVESPGSRKAGAARHHLDERYMLLLGLCAQAVTVVSASAQAQLKRVQERLVSEMRRPLVDGDAQRGARSEPVARGAEEK